MSMIMFDVYQKKNDPVAFYSEMRQDIQNAICKLNQIKNLSEFNRIFCEGEKGSIDHILKSLSSRLEVIKQLQLEFE